MQLVCYRGFGNSRTCRLTGRVLQYREPLPNAAESLWKNLADSYRRFETDEVPGTRVSVIVCNQRYDTHSDDEGYFSLEVPTPNIAVNGKIRVPLSLQNDTIDTWYAEIIIPPETAEFGIISDIDDTILITNATSILKMMRLTLLESSRSRLAFAGVAEFYAGLHSNRNPFFYVSSSPWNLYEFLDDFMKVNHLVPDTLSAAHHAASLGLLPEGRMASVASAVSDDLAPYAAFDGQMG